MWIFARQGFISVVEHRDNPDLLVVRARRHQHLGAIFPESKITHTPHADYRYRTTIDKRDLAQIIAAQIEGIDYDNFKSSIQDHYYHDACTGVWTVMHRLQPGSYYAGVRLAHEYGDPNACIPSQGAPSVEYPSPPWKPGRDT